MKLLALDTSSVACSVALLTDGRIAERHVESPREHTRILLPMIRELLGQQSVTLQSLDAIVLGNGPGSFIGMRIGASVVQGLAYGAGLPVVPISSLGAVAAEVFDTSGAGEVVVAQDAHMNEIYLGIFRRGEGGLPQVIGDERLHDQGRISGLREEATAGRLAAGSGWQRYPVLQEVNRPFFAGFADVQQPRARYLLGSGALALQNGQAIDAKYISPAYIRQKVAEKPATGP